MPRKIKSIDDLKRHARERQEKKKTIYNDPDKRKRTKRNIAKYFKQDPDGVQAKIAKFFGNKS